ncbi:MAG: hypothetical protein ABSE05_13830 [Syntrophales bacterium]
MNAFLINENIIKSIRAFCCLAPLHNPYNLASIELMRGLLPSIPQMTVFDTAFHQTMPIHAYTYALPDELCEKELVCRYGFRGTGDMVALRTIKMAEL